MIDYYRLLLPAVQALDAADRAAREAIYQRAWRAITDQLRASHSPISADDFRQHRAAFQTAIERIENGYAQAAPALEDERQRTDEFSSDSRQQLPRSKKNLRSRPALWLAIPFGLLVLVGAGGYAVWTMLFQGTSPNSRKIEVARRESPIRSRNNNAPSPNELPPGIDGGSTDADLPLIFRRQRVFYRTTLPTGTIVVDKLQHFAYLVLPHSTAVRYGIGVGESCVRLAGLQRIVRKVEWPEWRPSKNGAKVMPGRPGNPLGARALDLNDDVSRIHGTNAPKTIGEDVSFGCIRLVNDDVTDLYDRAELGTGVVLR